MNRLQGKAGLITAAASGMGQAGAKLFAQEGAKVLLVDINREAVEATAQQIREAGGVATAMVADLTSDQVARDIVARAVREYGRLDFMWNHHGHPGPVGLADAKPEDGAVTGAGADLGGKQFGHCEFLTSDRPGVQRPIQSR